MRENNVFGRDPSQGNELGEPKSVVSEGAYSGQVLSVVDGVMTQKINRSGDTVCHDVSKCTIPLNCGDIVTVQYRNGQTEVSKGVIRGVEK